MKFNHIALLLMLSLLVAACSGATPATTQSPSITQTEAPSSPESTVAATSEADNNLPESGVYQIVPGESRLTYEVGEVFINQNNLFNIAIGTTGQINGEITIPPDNPQASSLSPITADISQFTSDSNRRDRALKERFIESLRYPEVTFRANAVKGLPASVPPGQDVALTISGDLTIREVTNPVTFEVIARLEDQSLTGQATTTILMSDFGFGPINIAGILKTEDAVKITLDLVARP